MINENMATTIHADEHHYHPPGLQHQFEDMGQQQESASIGMWVFLAQEIMFFGGLFTAYLVFRSKYPMAFAAGSNHLDVYWGAGNTVVLIVSSLTMALAVHYAQLGKRNLQVIMLILTMIFGATFLGVKAVEYTDKYYEGIVPVSGLNLQAGKKTDGSKHISGDSEQQEKNSLDFPNDTKTKESGYRGTGEHHEYNNPRGEFQWADTSLVVKAQEGNYLTEEEKIGYFSNGEINAERFRDRVRIFFWIYFAMTGLHALHMIIGLGIMAWILWRAWRGEFSGDYYSPVEISGLYWHFVDIVWIFLFPLLYLLGRHFGAGH
ncbi:MAG: cytochrome c oxidase subunit 3 family protein [Pyrinomonadaceae bacterium]